MLYIKMSDELQKIKEGFGGFSDKSVIYFNFCGADGVLSFVLYF
jgi:hypothetical protein